MVPQLRLFCLHCYDFESCCAAAVLYTVTRCVHVSIYVQVHTWGSTGAGRYGECTPESVCHTTAVLHAGCYGPNRWSGKVRKNHEMERKRLS